MPPKKKGGKQQAQEPVQQPSVLGAATKRLRPFPPPPQEKTRYSKRLRGEQISQELHQDPEQRTAYGRLPLQARPTEDEEMEEEEQPGFIFDRPIGPQQERREEEEPFIFEGAPERPLPTPSRPAMTQEQIDSQLEELNALIGQGEEVEEAMEDVDESLIQRTPILKGAYDALKKAKSSMGSFTRNLEQAVRGILPIPQREEPPVIETEIDERMEEEITLQHPAYRRLERIAKEMNVLFQNIVLKWPNWKEGGRSFDILGYTYLFADIMKKWIFFGTTVDKLQGGPGYLDIPAQSYDLFRNVGRLLRLALEEYHIVIAEEDVPEENAFTLYKTGLESLKAWFDHINELEDGNTPVNEPWKAIVLDTLEDWESIDGEELQKEYTPEEIEEQEKDQEEDEEIQEEINIEKPGIFLTVSFLFIIKGILLIPLFW